MKRRLIPCLLFLALLCAAPRPSRPQIPVTDVAHIAVSTWAEIARYAQDAYQIYQHALSIYNQIQQIERQIQALKKLDARSWRDIGPLYHQLNSILQQRDTLTYAVEDLEEEFYATFPGTTRYVNFPTEHFNQVQRTLDTLRLNLLSLHQIHLDSQGSLQVLGEIQNHVDSAKGHEETLEALGELGSWQADQLATIGSTLQAIANTAIVASSYQINQTARERQSVSDVLLTTANRAEADAAEARASYTLLPSWMPPQ
jgi:P-type conjugative transfer protein TrbJ